MLRIEPVAEKFEREISGGGTVGGGLQLGEFFEIGHAELFDEVAYLSGKLNIEFVFSAEIVAYRGVVEVRLSGYRARARPRKRTQPELLEGGFDYPRLRVAALAVYKLFYVVFFGHLKNF